MTQPFITFVFPAYERQEAVQETLIRLRENVSLPYEVFICDNSSQKLDITTQDKENIFKEFGNDAKDSGSVYSQVALFTKKISDLTEHLKLNRKDYGTQRSLQLMVGKRRKLLDYLKGKDILKYRELVKNLGLRR